MARVKTHFAFYVIKANNTQEQMFLALEEARFHKAWIYPGKASSTGLLTANAAVCYIGEKGDGPDVTPDVINPADLPMAIELPQGETKSLSELFIYGTAGDGVLVKYWA